MYLKEKYGGLYLDLDILSDYEKVSTYEKFIETLMLEGYKIDQKDIFYIYIDEFQSYNDITKIMKNVYDHHKNIKIFASGSSALMIKGKVQESLAGRKIMNIIYPLNFEEYLFFKNDTDALKKLKNLKDIESEDIYDSIKGLYEKLEDFIIWGGYPGVVLSDNKVEKLTSIFDLFIKKDFKDMLKVENILGAKKIIQYLAINNGKMFTSQNAATFCSLDIRTVDNYIELLEELFIIKIIRPFYRNKNKEIIKQPKIYFIDTGVRNYFINNFNKLYLRQDNGELFENYILNEIIKKNHFQINYWREKIGHEVDFIIDEKLPLEIKFKRNLKASDLKGIKKFESIYNEKGIIINLSKQDSKIFRLPFINNIVS